LFEQGDVGVDEPWTLADSLSSVCADLLSFEKFEPFVHRLFASPRGSWRTVAECCRDLLELPQHAPELFADHADALVVTHLPWPEADSTGYALVLFVHTSELWSTIAAYNRLRLEQKGNAEHGGKAEPPCK
jgi:hypothetical protein